MTVHDTTSIPFDCVGIGLSTYDFTLELPEYPAVNTKHTATRYAGSGGGPVPTAVATLASLGCRTALVTSMGDDVPGNTILREFRNYSIDTSGVRLDPQIETLHSHILVEGHTGKRTVVQNTGDIPEILPEQVPEGLTQNTRYIAVDSRPSPTIIALVRQAKQYGAEVMLDAGSIHEHTEDLLPLVEYPVVSADFAREYFGHSNYESACRQLVKAHGTIAGVTMGTDGSVLADGSRTVYIPAFEVQAADTTGAGDVYHGGFLFGVLQAWPLKAIGQFAAATAAISVQYFGSRSRLPVVPEVREFLKEQGVSSHPVLARQPE